MTGEFRLPMTGRGYDFPVPLSTLPIGARFITYLEIPAWSLPAITHSGTLLWVGTGSVEIWWDDEKESCRVAPELDVYLLEEEPLTLDLIAQYGECHMTAESTTTSPGAKACIARFNYQLNQLLQALDGDDKAKASICLSRIEKAVGEARQMHLALPPVPDALASYEPLTEVIDHQRILAENAKAEDAAAETRKQEYNQRQTDREVAKEKHVSSVAGDRAASKAPKAPKAAKKLRPCLDGCGTMVPGNFQMGHDAKLKSKLLKIEKGELGLDQIPEPCLDLVKIVKGESIQERDAQGQPKGEPKQTYRITAAPVRFPGRDDIAFTTRED